MFGANMVHLSVCNARATTIIIFLQLAVYGSQIGGARGQPSAASCIMPTHGCGHGRFNLTTCLCHCDNALAADGYCRDENGICMVRKYLDPDTQLHTCPTFGSDAGPTVVDAPSSSPSMAASASPATVPAPTPSPTAVLPTPAQPTPAAVDDSACAHPELSYSRLSMSGTADPSYLSSLALVAVDASCETCVPVQLVRERAYLEIVLASSMEVAAVSLVAKDTVTLTVCIGNNTSSDASSVVCTPGVNAIGSTKTLVPVSGKGDSIVILSDADMVLCDVFPIPKLDTTNSWSLPQPPTTDSEDGSQPSLPPSTDVQLGYVKVDLDITGTTADVFQQYSVPILCDTLTKLTRDPSATCRAASITPNEKAPLSLHAALVITTTNPQSISTESTALELLLRPVTSLIGLQIVPGSTKVASEEIGGPASPDTAQPPPSPTTAPSPTAIVESPAPEPALVDGADEISAPSSKEQAPGPGVVPSIAPAIGNTTAEPPAVVSPGGMSVTSPGSSRQEPSPSPSTSEGAEATTPKPQQSVPGNSSSSGGGGSGADVAPSPAPSSSSGGSTAVAPTPAPSSISSSSSPGLAPSPAPDSSKESPPPSSSDSKVNTTLESGSSDTALVPSPAPSSSKEGLTSSTSPSKAKGTVEGGSVKATSVASFVPGSQEGTSPPSSGSGGSSSGSSSGTNTAAIVGGIVGGVAAAAVVAGIGIYVARARRQKADAFAAQMRSSNVLFEPEEICVQGGTPSEASDTMPSPQGD